ncbi:MAG: hypothetical protein TEF_04225 [Rhizobiales bacterium NRL2]|jgi:hypothetical protein|nr:MAG: hypothetical protein TEF_04225 [Rhizobiales bacterium NRL2]
MAFKIEELERMAGGGAGFAMWGYVTTDDDLADVTAAGYFDEARDMLRVDDWVFIRAGDGSGVAIVNANAGGTVDLTDATQIGAADTA